MPRTPCTQSDRSCRLSLATRALAVGMVICAVTTAYPFAPGILPDENCDRPPVRPSCYVASGNVYEEVHQKITDEALTLVAFTPAGGASVRFSPQALKEIKDGNAETDYNQGDPALHFDNAFLPQGGKRLIDGKEELLKQLRQSSILTATQASTLRSEFGGYLHTLAGFLFPFELY